VKGAVGVDCYVGLVTDFEENILSTLRGNCRLGLVDGRVTKNLCDLAEKLNLSCLIGTVGLRRQVPGWQGDSMSIRHCEFGGITTGLTRGICLTRGHPPSSRNFTGDCGTGREHSFKRNCPLSQVSAFSSKVHRLTFGMPEFGVVRTASLSWWGHLPGSIDRKTWVLTPGVYASKKSWALRLLTVEEVLIAKDNGRLLTKFLVSDGLDDQFLRNLVPGKSLIALARRWGYYGGSLFFPDATASPRASLLSEPETGRNVKARRLNGAIASKDKTVAFDKTESVACDNPKSRTRPESKDRTVAFDKTEAVAFNNPKSRTCPESKDRTFAFDKTESVAFDEDPKSQTRPESKDRTVAFDKGGLFFADATGSPRASLPLELETGSNVKARRFTEAVAFDNPKSRTRPESKDSSFDNPKSRTRPESEESTDRNVKARPSPSSTETLGWNRDSMLDPARDLDAFADAADLEASAQENLLAEIDRVNRERKAVKVDDAEVPKYLWEDQLLEGLPGRIWEDEGVIKRVRLVTGWLRRKMLSWWKRKVTTSYVAWAQAKYYLDTNSNKIDEVKWKDDWVEVDVCGRKIWKKGRLEWSDENGLHRYQKWWKNRSLVTHQDYEPAADAIQHATDSSWWSWDNGSRPFHWRWSTFYQEVIRDGLKVYFQAEPPKY
jgi:hypothetical protein